RLGIERVLQTITNLCAQSIKVSLIELRSSYCALRLAGFGHQLFDGSNNFLDLGMAKLDGVDDNIFRHTIRTAFDHHDAVSCSYDGDVDRAIATLSVGRVDDELAIDLTYAYCTDGAA